VLPDGRIWDGLSALRKDNTGYDLKQLFLGAEGTLGVITAAVCKLFPAPITRETALCAVTELAAACRLLGMVRRSLGDCVVSFEFLARPALELVLANISDTRDPFVAAHPAYVLLELTGGHAARGLREELMAVYADAEAQGLVGDALIAESESQRSAWWRLREQIPAAERAAGGSIKHDVSVALADLPTLAQRAGAAVVSRHPGVRVSMYGHVGDGNLHFNVLAPVGADPETFRAAHAASVSDLVHRTAVELGGSFSAEHGVGQLKRDLLRVTESPIALDLMREIKAAVDPKDLMNPGKVL
jgi:FAD/FMN-containing dehydrogenase